MNLGSGILTLVPVKRFSAAKSRLAPLLDAGERSTLARMMFEDVLDLLLQCQEVLAGIAVVTSDQDAAAWTRQRGAAVLFDQGDNGINAAIGLAIERIGRDGDGGIMVVPSDVPQVSPNAIVKAVEAVTSPRALAIAPAADGGTNLLACRPVGATPLCFGPRSFDRHRRAAVQAGLSVQALALPELSLDIDRPEDLRAFFLLESKTRTHAYLLRLGIGGRLGRRDHRERQPADCAVTGGAT
ncbi:MAG TPA: 2-phospho-L-lactate guanylyltransferase [Xanthobacteraceae bacterium]|nr:2-phospho-L-lactate guanylyltransferase [Xanthobacteraceae bacterium]